MAEVIAGALWVGRVGRHGHETVNFDFWKGVDLFEIVEEGGGGVTEFAGFAGDIDLEQDGDGFADFVGLAIDFLGEGEAVYAFEHVEDLNGVAAFIGLKMADHVPAKATWAERNFCFGFLNFVFAEEGLAEAGCFGDGVRAVALGDGEELDVGGVAVAAGAGGGDAQANVFEIGADIHFTSAKN